MTTRKRGENQECCRSHRSAEQHQTNGQFRPGGTCHETKEARITHVFQDRMNIREHSCSPPLGTQPSIPPLRSHTHFPHMTRHTTSCWILSSGFFSTFFACLYRPPRVHISNGGSFACWPFFGPPPDPPTTTTPAGVVVTVPPPPGAAGGGGGFGLSPFTRLAVFPGPTRTTWSGFAASAGAGAAGGSGIGHIFMVMVQSGSTVVSQTWGRMISPLGPIRS